MERYGHRGRGSRGSQGIGERGGMPLGTMGRREAFGAYTIRLTHEWGILHYSEDTEGGLFVVRECHGWRVRGTGMAFDF